MRQSGAELPASRLRQLSQKRWHVFGRGHLQPCISSPASRSRSVDWASVSTLSATTRSFNACASEITALTMFRLFSFRVRSTRRSAYLYRSTWQFFRQNLPDWHDAGREESREMGREPRSTERLSPLSAFL
jgi:hypothetical protein